MVNGMVAKWHTALALKWMTAIGRIFHGGRLWPQAVIARPLDVRALL
jgi:hypothetical protein